MNIFLKTIVGLLCLFGLTFLLAPRDRRPVFAEGDTVYLLADGFHTMPLHVTAVAYPSVTVTWLSNGKTESRTLHANQLTKNE